MKRPSIFLDTDVCINAAKGRIPADEWQRVCHCLDTQYRYRISFITLKELLIGLARCEDEFFDSTKDPLRIVYEPSRRKFLAYPPVFAARTALGLAISRTFDRRCAPTEEKYHELIYKAVLRASGKEQLKTVGVPHPHFAGRRFTFNLDHFDSHEDTPQNEYVCSFQSVRDGRVDKPDPLTMAKLMLEDMGVTSLDSGEYKKLAESLDAAYQHVCKTSELIAQNQNYNISKHKNNWGDQMQLYYLCDESMHFLTCEKRFLDCTAGSFQQSRILLYKDFVKSL